MNFFLRHREALILNISGNVKRSFSKEANILSETIYMKVKVPRIRILFESIMYKMKS